MKPEPFSHVAGAYLMGILAGIASLQLYNFAEWCGAPTYAGLGTSNVHIAIYFLGIVGPIEELAKFLPFVLICRHWREFDEIIDGFVYASAIALGFASYETFLHLPYLEGAELYGAAIARPLVHTVFASIWGLATGWAKMHGKPILPIGILALLLASALHGLYDILTLHPLYTLAGAFQILVLWLIRTAILRKLHDKAAQEESGADCTARKK